MFQVIYNFKLGMVGRKIFSFCVVCGFTSQLTAMVMLRRLVYLTTLFPRQAWQSNLEVFCAQTFLYQ